VVAARVLDAARVGDVPDVARHDDLVDLGPVVAEDRLRRDGHDRRDAGDAPPPSVAASSAAAPGAGAGAAPAVARLPAPAAAAASDQ